MTGAEPEESDSFDDLLERAARAPRVTPPTELPRTGDVIDDKYEVGRCIGRGGMGAVYSARNVLTGRAVALKFVLPRRFDSPRLSDRFLREARAASRVEHPHVVDVYDVGRYGGAPYLVMELLRGESLGERLKRGPLSSEEAIEVLLAVTEALSAAHERGIVHRDLKPDNVYLCRTAGGDPLPPKVLDFGISKMRPQEEAHLSTLTDSGTIVGTPAFMAPEQLRDPSSVDHRADVYALGATLYAMLSGKTPFDAKRYDELLVRVATEAPVPLDERLKGIPQALQEVVHRAMQKDPAERYASARELGEALRSLQATSLTPTPDGKEGARPASSPDRSASRWTTWRSRAVLAVLGLAVGAWALARSGGTRQAHVPPAASAEPRDSLSSPPRLTTTTRVGRAALSSRTKASPPAGSAPGRSTTSLQSAVPPVARERPGPSVPAQGQLSQRSSEGERPSRRARPEPREAAPAPSPDNRAGVLTLEDF